ncbi:hypothetical protein LDVICp084 [lymphocystis disease virus-China]|uniref:Uncharacterized protein n=1 Tax=lymphocystis disease virus-China TaxID=256729 RepID=Q678C7_9VIRU|nr:hypothetical protein LDVICp084 [lymphocystis disease virus-China]AAU10930.1 hypothetical protein [lymphocystis disease virus-China]
MLKPVNLILSDYKIRNHCCVKYILINDQYVFITIYLLKIF